MRTLSPPARFSSQGCCSAVLAAVDAQGCKPTLAMALPARSCRRSTSTVRGTQASRAGRSRRAPRTAGSYPAPHRRTLAAAVKCVSDRHVVWTGSGRVHSAEHRDAYAVLTRSEWSGGMRLLPQCVHRTWAVQHRSYSQQPMHAVCRCGHSVLSACLPGSDLRSTLPPTWK